MTDCKKVRKTSNSHPSAYIGTVGRELRSKSKSLRSKPVFDYKVRNSPFLQIKTQRTKPHKLLTDFDDYGLFDSLSIRKDGVRSVKGPIVSKIQQHISLPLMREVGRL